MFRVSIRHVQRRSFTAKQPLAPTSTPSAKNPSSSSATLKPVAPTTTTTTATSFPAQNAIRRQVLTSQTPVPPTPAAVGSSPSPSSIDEKTFPSSSAFDNEANYSPHQQSSTSTPFSAAEFDPVTSFSGLSSQPFPKEIADVLLAEVEPTDIEIKPDGMPYLPEIKYRRILNRAFGPGGWGLVPRGPHTVSNKTISREYALFALGRFVSSARGDQDFFKEDDLPTKTEGVKSNALMRCCKDLGIASELWDPNFIYQWKTRYAVQAVVVNSSKGTRTMMWRRKDRPFEYPFKEEIKK